jgi:antitoxin FitA
MTTITIALDDERMRRLREAANLQGRTVEEMIGQTIDDYFTRRQTFENAADYVLAKNAELYRRLAK